MTLCYKSYVDRGIPQSYLPGTNSAEDAGHIWDVSGRLTWQASGPDHIAVFVQSQTRQRPLTVSTTTSPEASGLNTLPGQTYQVRWTRVQSANLLFDAAYQRFNLENRVQHVDLASGHPRCCGMREEWCYDSIMTPRTETHQSA